MFRGRTRLRASATTGALLASLVCGCATIEYGPLGGKPAARFAYKETPNGEARYTLMIIGSGVPDMNVMQAMWDRRAQELCRSSQYTKVIFRADRPTTLYGYYGGAAGQPVLEGFLDCSAKAT
jgi:hypothetical protein